MCGFLKNGSILIKSFIIVQIVGIILGVKITIRSITVNEYDKLAGKTDSRIREIDAELINLEQSDEPDEMTISNLLNLAKNADVLLKSSKPAVKNQILRLLVSNLKIEQKKLSFELLEPFKYLHSISINKGSLSPNNSASYNKIGRTRGVVRPIWLPGLDSNQQPRS